MRDCSVFGRGRMKRSKALVRVVAQTVIVMVVRCGEEWC